MGNEHMNTWSINQEMNNEKISTISSLSAEEILISLKINLTVYIKDEQNVCIF